ncbi:C-mannosyltransferase dpy-19 like [Pseudolycoriella hygida]|uniref:C-mannosyltransferase dpy-19 like n=1 Tax=Pseudolycoriella hygida TaxID=35572 RepID=A0A9Q0MUD9_9DIPT|nr:C-mannosyltransferase dpy-19 like [Pseudolycoriella hygida]
MFFDTMGSNKPLLVASQAFIGMGLFFVHVFHVSYVFESETNFSNLDNVGRELIFKSDHALYYSYYKTIADAPDFVSGFNKLMSDNRTEYPNSINTIYRFHIFPEIVLGYLYKYFLAVTNYLEISTKTCLYIDGYASCEGLGVPIYFYLESVWYMGGFTVFVLFMYATHLSGNIIGGVAAVAYYFAIHNDATRIHRYPAARENFAYPFILSQMLYLSICIKADHYSHSKKAPTKRTTCIMITKLAINSTLAVLSWHFSQYIFGAQSVIMYTLLQFDMISFNLFSDYVISQFASNMIAYYVMLENEKFFPSIHMTVLFTLLLFASMFKLRKKPSDTRDSFFRRIYMDYVFNFLFVLIIFCDIVRAIYGENFRDSVDMLYKDLILSKLLIKPPSFNTLVYLCNWEMGFIDLDTVKTYNKLFVGKFFGVSIVIFLSKWLQKRREINENSEDKIERAKNYLIEDYLEENRVSMKDLVNTDMDKEIKACLEALKKCNYDYERYKREKVKNVRSKVNERAAFLKDVQKFKEEISGKEKITAQNVSTKLPVDKDLNQMKNEEEVPSEDRSDKKEENEKEEKNNKSESQNANKAKEDADIVYRDHFIQPHYFYNVLQTLTFLSMAGLVVKLKYLLTPFMCLMASSLPPKSWFPNATYRYWFVYLFLVFCSIAETGIENIQNQYEAKGFTDHQLKQAVDWINVNTDADAVFAGPADLVTTIMLTTNRPVVNHSRLEFFNMRERTKLVYSMFSRQPYTQIYNQLSRLEVQYIIAPLKECVSPKRRCKILDIWDDIEPENRGNVPLCAELLKKSNPNFLRVFMNEEYFILKLFSQYVQVEFGKNSLTELSI